MSYIKAGTDVNGNDVKLHYIDQGQGSPIVLIHGWPATYEMWEYQLAELPKHGHRVIAYTRRGFGNSSKTWEGNDYDTLADDLNAVLETLDLQDVTLVGFSMGGGEVARYMSRYNGARVSKVAFVSAVTPFLLKTDDNPDGADKSVFDDMVDGIRKDRFDFLQSFGKKFFGVGVISHPVSQATLDWMQSICQLASPRATEQCVYAFAATDFRQDLATLKVPTLVIHGSSDDTVPAKVSGERMTQYVSHAQFVEYSGAPHGLFVTEKERLNRDILAFAAGGTVEGTADRY
ncbi:MULTISPECIES: alpha/beta fold hydrolase [Hymenobacter]|uniref:Pimeloyl-ACP methyl ester carboxylesterase n=1 Tax=Hymenobacter mucosus TaxID=1411120 RepID=A0A238W144_9BACT|nr:MULTISPECIES: alpha/beta hydrolase [Hymenobacter]SNR39873.1 Pimeloyl-ACP methyl ester carboxylesterase [Hymenobacter mucosus]